METLASLWIQAPTPQWAASVEKMGVVAIVVLAFALFVYGLMTNRLVTGNRFAEMEAHYQLLLSERAGEINELKQENRDQNAQVVRLAADMVRLNDQYQQLVRETLWANVKRGPPDEH